MIINSILDNDLYSFTVGRAVLERFPNTYVEYNFINRTKEMTFSKEAFEQIVQEIKSLESLYLRESEFTWLNSTLDFLSESYLCWLKNMRFNPDKEIKATHLKSGQIELTVSGDWSKTIFYEVPLLAIISEVYFKFMDTDWNHEGQEEQHKQNAIKLSKANCKYADFGTRRRRNFQSQYDVVNTMKHHRGFIGTSNVLLAMNHGVKPVGTQSHQWIMGVSALKGLRYANLNSMDDWIKTYEGDLGIALTDTYGSDAFFEDFNLKYSKTFDGVRHDSGDPFEFVDKTIKAYKKHKIDTTSKTIVFSDGLDVMQAIDLNKYCDENNINCSFGIGTFLTNFFLDSEGERSEPLAIVIKLKKVNGLEVVKLSDYKFKATGDPDAIRVANWTFHNQPLDKRGIK